MSCFLFTVRSPSFFVHILPSMPFIHRSRHLTAPPSVSYSALKGSNRPLSSVTRFRSSGCMLVSWPFADCRAFFVLRASPAVDPTSTWASSPFIAVVPSNSSWPSLPRSSVFPHQMPVSASSFTSTSDSSQPPAVSLVLRWSATVGVLRIGVEGSSCSQSSTEP